MRLPCVRRVLVLAGLLALAACSSDATAPSGSTTTVSIRQFYFYPFELAVRVGASVEWINYDPVSHTATSDLGLWDSGPLTPATGPSRAGGSFRFTFQQPGTYGYHCTIHPPSLYPNFVGIVVVRP
jgi:plastocyanin